MIIGVGCQIIFGNSLAIVKIYELHVLFRFLTASSCALMYTSGSMICKLSSTVLSKPMLSFNQVYISVIIITNKPISHYFSYWHNKWCGKNDNIASIWIFLVDWFNHFANICIILGGMVETVYWHITTNYLLDIFDQVSF